MGKHRAPEAEPDPAPVVRLPARRARARRETSGPIYSLAGTGLSGSLVGVPRSVVGRPAFAGPMFSSSKIVSSGSGSASATAGLLFPVVDDLSMIAADDQLLDGIAAGLDEFPDLFGVPGSYPARRDSLSPLLATWRSELVDPPLPELPTMILTQPARAAGRPPARRSLRPILGIAAAICALLMGSAAIGAHSATPGDALWPLAQVLYSDHADSVEAKVAANESLLSAADALNQGDAPKAFVALTSASNEVNKVAAVDGKEELQLKLTLLLNQAAVIAPLGDGTSSINTTSRALDAAVPDGTLASSSRIAAAASAAASSKASVAAKIGSTTTAATGTSGAPRGTTPVVVMPPPATTQPTVGPTGSTGPVVAPPHPTHPVDTGSTAPAPPTPTSSAPPTSDPGTTTDPGTSTTPGTSSDPGTPASTSDPGTSASTTSELPTPTPTPSDAGTTSAQDAGNPQVNGAQAAAGSTDGTPADAGVVGVAGVAGQ